MTTSSSFQVLLYSLSSLFPHVIDSRRTIDTHPQRRRQYLNQHLSPLDPLFNLSSHFFKIQVFDAMKNAKHEKDSEAHRVRAISFILVNIK